MADKKPLFATVKRGFIRHHGMEFPPKAAAPGDGRHFVYRLFSTI